MNFIKLLKKWSGQTGPARLGPTPMSLYEKGSPGCHPLAWDNMLHRWSHTHILHTVSKLRMQVHQCMIVFYVQTGFDEAKRNRCLIQFGVCIPNERLPSQNTSYCIVHQLYMALSQPCTQAPPSFPSLPVHEKVGGGGLGTRLALSFKRLKAGKKMKTTGQKEFLKDLWLYSCSHHAKIHSQLTTTGICVYIAL